MATIFKASNTKLKLNKSFCDKPTLDYYHLRGQSLKSIAFVNLWFVSICLQTARWIFLMLQAKSNKKDCDPRTIHSLMRGTKQMRRVRAKIETTKARAGEILPRNFCQSIDVIGYLRWKISRWKKIRVLKGRMRQFFLYSFCK